MPKMLPGRFQMICPLTGTVIDSDLCIEVQECIDESIPVTLELEEFTEIDNCMAHIINIDENGLPNIFTER